MVSLRRQELIILLRHSFRSLNVDPHTSSYGIDSRHQGNRHCCSSLPVRHQRIYTFWRCGEHRVFIIRDEFRFSSFRRYLTVGLFHFRRECICRCDSGTRVATAYILNRVEDGEYGVAIAYGSILIVVMLAIIFIFDWLIGESRTSRSKAKNQA